MKRISSGNAVLDFQFKQAVRQEVERLKKQWMSDAMDKMYEQHGELFEAYRIDALYVATMCWCTMLHRKYGFGSKRIGDAIEAVAEIMDWVNDGPLKAGDERLAKLEEELRDECGIRVTR